MAGRKPNTVTAPGMQGMAELSKFPLEEISMVSLGLVRPMLFTAVMIF